MYIRRYNFWLYRELHICGVSKMLGEWYQKTNKIEDTNKLTLLVLKIIAILHNYTVGNIHKASEN
jgi:CobQ-like glutamine amidotransferase family enzyme